MNEAKHVVDRTKQLESNMAFTSLNIISLPASIVTWILAPALLMQAVYCQPMNNTQATDTCPSLDNGTNSSSIQLSRNSTRPPVLPDPFADALDERPYEAQFSPSASFQNTLKNNTAVSGSYSQFLGCACNISYVSYACCDAPNGLVNEDPISNMGSFSRVYSNSTENSSAQYSPPAKQFVQVITMQTGISVASSVSATSASAGPTHHVCSGYCHGASRICSWGFTGDCECGALRSEILFWMNAPCYPTESNPNKQHDKRRSIPSGPGKGPLYSLDREAGICNDSYISYACADTKDGIVHEPLQNWLGALLPPGSKEYPPIPQEFLDVHGIKERPVLGPIDLPYWPTT